MIISFSQRPNGKGSIRRVRARAQRPTNIWSDKAPASGKLKRFFRLSTLYHKRSWALPHANRCSRQYGPGFPCRVYKTAQVRICTRKVGDERIWGKGGGNSPYGHSITPDNRLSRYVREVHVQDRAGESIYHHLRVVDVVVDVRRLSHDSSLSDLPAPKSMTIAHKSHVLLYRNCSHIVLVLGAKSEAIVTVRVRAVGSSGWSSTRAKVGRIVTHPPR